MLIAMPTSNNDDDQGTICFIKCNHPPADTQAWYSLFIVPNHSQSRAVWPSLYLTLWPLLFYWQCEKFVDFLDLDR